MSKANHLSPAQLRLLQKADEYGVMRGWMATHATLQSLLTRGLIHLPHINYARDSEQLFYLTDAGRAALIKATT